MAVRQTHRAVPRKLPDGPIRLFPVQCTGEPKIVDGHYCREVVIDQRTWSILLDVIVRQDARAQKLRGTEKT